MDARAAFGLVGLLVLVGAASVSAQTPSSDAANSSQIPPDSSAMATSSPQEAAESPSTNAALIARGDGVYHGPGNCYACHGSTATGSVGPDLTDAEWIHSKGSYEEIVAQILAGISREQSKSGIAMPPKGGGTLSDDDVKAVAAYVYSLSQK